MSTMTVALALVLAVALLWSAGVAMAIVLCVAARRGDEQIAAQRGARPRARRFSRAIAA
jgi:hypothetical protein